MIRRPLDDFAEGIIFQGGPKAFPKNWDVLCMLRDVLGAGILEFAWLGCRFPIACSNAQLISLSELLENE